MLRKSGSTIVIQFEAFDAEKMPFDDARFDAIFFCGVLHHIEERCRTDVMNECIRTMKPHGVICILEPNHNAIKIVKEHIPSHPDPADPNMYTEPRTLSNEIIAGDFFERLYL